MSLWRDGIHAFLSGHEFIRKIQMLTKFARAVVFWECVQNYKVSLLPTVKRTMQKYDIFKNANNSDVLTELSSFLLSPKAVCTIQYNAFHYPAIKMWCVEGGGWAYIRASSCTHFFSGENIPQLASELRIPPLVFLGQGKAFFHAVGAWNL